jgi:hypothetical protein
MKEGKVFTGATYVFQVTTHGHLLATQVPWVYENGSLNVSLSVERMNEDIYKN